MAAKLYAYVPENGLVHYEAGMRGSICANFNPNRKGTTDTLKVTCPQCIKNIRATRLTKI